MKFLKVIYFLLAFAVVSISVIAFGSHSYFNSQSVYKDKFFIVNKGDNFHKITINLVKENIIQEKDRKLFYYISKIIYKNNIKIRAGEYFFLNGETPLNIINKLKKGDVFFRKITFAEGLSNDSMLKLIDSAPGLIGNLPSEEVVEGTLLPETYLYTAGETKRELIIRMQKAMVEFFNKEWENRAPNLPFKTKTEALNLASIVEKETGVPEERGMVASVFINRVRNGWKLDSDPTVVYAFTNGNKDLERPIRKSDLQRISEYNTYVIQGIPSKAIANPGKDSIKAVLNPKQTDYLFFVATGNGGHNFSKTLEEHNKFVEEYRNKVGGK